MTCMTNMTLLQGWCILETALFFNKRLNILFWNSFISQTKKSRSFLLLHCDKQHLKCINFATISCASTWQMHRLCNNVMCIDMTKFACFLFFFEGGAWILQSVINHKLWGRYTLVLQRIMNKSCPHLTLLFAPQKREHAWYLCIAFHYEA